MIKAVIASILFGVLVIAGLLYTTTPGGEEHFLLAMVVVVLGLVSFMALFAWQLFQLFRRLRHRNFGSGLVLRAFRQLALMALVPGLVLFVVSGLLLAYSVNTWFLKQYDAVQQSATELRERMLEDKLSGQREDGRWIARRLAEMPPGRRSGQLTALSQTHKIDLAAIYDARRVETAYSGSGYELVAARPPAEAFIGATQSGIWSVVEREAGKEWQMKVLYWVEPENISQPPFFLYTQRAVGDKELSSFLDRMDVTAREGQAQIRREARELGWMHFLVLGLVLLLSLFVALAFAMIFAERWVDPLRRLGQGQRAVTGGVYNPLPDAFKSRDELGQLIRGFNNMAMELGRKEADLRRGKVYLEDLLESLSTAVITLDSQFRVRLVNERAEIILSYPSSQLEGLMPHEWGMEGSDLRAFGEAVEAHFVRMPETEAIANHPSHAVQFWQEPHVEYQVGDIKHILLVRGTRIAASEIPEYALVFDDITSLLQIQKAAAWNEMARRLAHEIRNPLTPIQLSIGRLQHRLAKGLEPAQSKMLEQASGAILFQVDQIRILVDELSQYARLPAPVVAPLDLNALVEEVLHLYAGHVDVDLFLELAPDLPAAAADRGLMSKVLINLIKNAFEATEPMETPRVVIRTGAVDGGVCLCVEDNGPGFNERQMARLFEPYATTKPKGSGLGMSIVKRIVDDHQGQIKVHNVDPHGAAISITLPLMEEITRE